MEIATDRRWHADSRQRARAIRMLRARAFGAWAVSFELYPVIRVLHIARPAGNSHWEFRRSVLLRGRVRAWCQGNSSAQFVASLWSANLEKNFLAAVRQRCCCLNLTVIVGSRKLYAPAHCHIAALHACAAPSRNFAHATAAVERVVRFTLRRQDFWPPESLQFAGKARSALHACKYNYA